MRMMHRGLRLRLGLRARWRGHKSSVAFQNLDWSHLVKVSPSDFVNLRMTIYDLRGDGKDIHDFGLSQYQRATRRETDEMLFGQWFALAAAATAGALAHSRDAEKMEQFGRVFRNFRDFPIKISGAWGNKLFAIFRTFSQAIVAGWEWSKRSAWS
jgi:hypothetical protein